jgi:hypothetical protein
MLGDPNEASKVERGVRLSTPKLSMQHSTGCAFMTLYVDSMPSHGTRHSGTQHLQRSLSMMEPFHARSKIVMKLRTCFKFSRWRQGLCKTKRPRYDLALHVKFCSKFCSYVPARRSGVVAWWSDVFNNQTVALFRNARMPYISACIENAQNSRLPVVSFAATLS